MCTLTEIPTEKLQSTLFLIMYSLEVIRETYRYAGTIEYTSFTLYVTVGVVFKHHSMC
jgi:hypothetical protein